MNQLIQWNVFFIESREEEGRKRIKSLQRQIQNVKVELEEEIQQRNEMIAHLKDQLQEMKAKTSMEGKYVQKDAEVAVSQVQKRCTLSEKQLRDEIEVNLILRSHIQLAGAPGPSINAGSNWVVCADSNRLCNHTLGNVWLVLS